MSSTCFKTMCSFTGRWFYIHIWYKQSCR